MDSLTLVVVPVDAPLVSAAPPALTLTLVSAPPLLVLVSTVPAPPATADPVFVFPPTFVGLSTDPVSMLVFTVPA